MKTLIAILILLIPTSGILANIEVANTKLEVGESTVIRVSEATDSLIVAYRPSSAVVETVFIVNESPSTNFDWSPKKAGVVALSYVQADGTTVSKNVSVRFAGVSYSGIIVMITAGFILFGGAGLAFRTLFQDEAEDGTIDFDPDHLPDT